MKFYFRLIFFLLPFTLTTTAFSDEFDFEEEAKKDNVIVGDLGLIDGVQIKFKRGHEYSMGHSVNALLLTWKHPTKKDCCEKLVFDETSDGSDERPRLQNDLVIWKVSYVKGFDKKDNVIVKSITHCWRLSKDKLTFQKQKKCPK